MAYRPISGSVPQFLKNSTSSADDYYLKFYDEGTTTPRSMATDDTGGTTLAKCKLNSRGEPISNDSDDTTVFIPHMNGDYKIVLYANATDADNNTTANALFVVDNIPYSSPTQEVFGSIAALQGADTSKNVAYLNAGGRSGHFHWDASDLSTEVTADTQQGIYVAPTSDATGASGAWVRNYSGPINVKWFGAIGDGVTDDTTALVKTLGTSGREVSFTTGETYLISGEVSIASDVTIHGNGATIKYSSMPTGTGPNFYGLWADAKENIKIYNLEIDGNKSAYSPCDAWGIYFRNCDNVEVAHCHIHDCWRIGIGAGQVATGQTTNGWFHHNYIYNIGDATEATQYGNGIAILHARYILIESNIVENIYGTAGINLEGDSYSDITVRNNLVKAGTGSNLRGIMQFESGADIHDNIIIEGNIVLDQPAAGITFSGNGSRIIANNVVRGCGEEGIKNFTASNSDITIAGNQVFDCGDLGFAGINVATALNLIATDNLVSECPVGSTVGMTFTATESAEIRGNNVNDCQTNAYEIGLNNFSFVGNKANNVGAIGSGTNYFLKNRTSFTNTNGFVGGNVLTQGAGTITAMWLVNGGNWVDVEYGGDQCEPSVTRISFSSASNSKINKIAGPNAPDLSSVFGDTAAWLVGDIVYDETPSASGQIGWVCVTAGTPGTWKAFGTIAA